MNFLLLDLVQLALFNQVQLVLTVLNSLKLLVNHQLSDGLHLALVGYSGNIVNHFLLLLLQTEPSLLLLADDFFEEGDAGEINPV